MQIPVLVEAVNGTGYRASSGQPLAASAEGATEDEALRKLSDLLAARIAVGARLVQLDVPTTDHPWMAIAGIFEHDPNFEQWQQDIAEYRRQVDADADVS